MAHFAQLDENNIVINVIVVDNDEVINPITGIEEEILGIAFCKKLLGGDWVQTSYNRKFRKNFAGLGYTYDAQLDAFVPPKLYPSWVLNNETAIWEPPVGPAPLLTQEQLDSGYVYDWDEENLQWQLINKNV